MRSGGHGKVTPTLSLAARARLREAAVTKREAEVLFLLPDRLSNAEIADRLFISERTVESHVSSLLRKLGTPTRTALAELARSFAPDREVPRALDPSQFVGRTRELDVLHGEVSAMTRHGFRAVMALGEPGVGKTRLAGEFLSRQGDALALWARAFPLGATTSLSLWADALDVYLRQLADGVVRRLCGTGLDDLAALLPIAAEVRGSVPPRKPARRRIVEVIGLLLRRLAADQPVVIVFDDAHLADGSSWEALEHLASHLGAYPVLVVLTARPVELARHSVASDVLLRLEQESSLRRLTLSPFDAGEVGYLAAAILGEEATVSETLVEWLMARSWGNPLYVVGLVQALVEEGADLDAPCLPVLPESLGERVQARLRGLDRTALDILELLAVLGRPATAPELVSVNGAPLPDLVEPLEALLDAGLAAERERGRELRYEVAHPMIAEVIYQRVSGARRRVLHRRVADHLRAAGRLAESASHFARGADLGDAEAVAALQEALRDAGDREAYQEALAILGTLTGVLPAGDHRWLEVLDALSHEAQWLLGHRLDVDAMPGIQAMQAMDAVLGDSPDLVRRGIVKLRLASLYSYGTGRLEEADLAARQALQLFQTAGDRPRVLLAEMELAAQRLVAGDLAGLQSAAERLLAQAERLGDPLLVMEIAGWLAIGRYSAGHFDEAEILFLRSASIADKHGQAFHGSWSRALLAISRAVAGTVASAGPLLAEAESRQPPAHESLVQECACVVHWASGNFAEALRRMETTLRWHGGRLAKRRGFALPFGALAAAEMARTDEARHHLRRAHQLYADADFAFYRDWVEWAEAVVAGLEGLPDEMLIKAQQAARRTVDAGCHAFAAFILTDLAELAADAEDATTAGHAADELDTLAHMLGKNLHRGLALLAGATARTIRGQPASQPAAEAAQIFTELGYQAYAGRALYRLGVALAADQGEAARSAFGQAAQAFDQCGAVVRRDRALRHLLR